MREDASIFVSIMSSFYTNLSDRFHSNVDENELILLINEHFDRIDKPFDDFLNNLSMIIENDPNHRQKNFVRFLVAAFRQWKDKSNSTMIESNWNFDQLLLRDLPLNSIKDFVEICQLSKEYLLNLIRSSLKLPMNSFVYKRALNLLVQLNYQTEFEEREILLPLILNSKDHLINVFLNEDRQNEENFIRLLNELYENGGNKIDEILKGKYRMTDVKFSKKTLSKLAVRYWNLYGEEQNAKYPNLATLQSKRTLGYLISLKYKNFNEEKTMSDECWNELVEDICRDDIVLAEYLLEVLADKDDLDAVRYWINHLHLSPNQLPTWIQKYLNTQAKTTAKPVQSTPSIDFYKTPISSDRIFFVDSTETYERFANRLFSNENEELIIGFDCEWKPLFNQNSTTKQRISVMQIALQDEIYLLDLLNFFHTCDPTTVHQRLAQRLFDDDHVTLLCYGFRSDAAMLIASYPIFDQALRSGRTLLDLSAVHLESADIFPFAAKTNDKGLSELVRLCCGKPLNKSEQCSNWERRPLRPAQIAYAANDAFSLLDIYNVLCDRAQKRDYLRSLRGVKPKKLDSMINRQIDENFSDKDTQVNRETDTASFTIPSKPIRPSQIKFVVDNMLNGLGRELRVAGCDTIILGNDDPHTDAIRYARSENRIILSTGGPYNLLRSHAVEGRCWQPPLNVSAKAQCRATLDHFNVKVRDEDIFSRCTLCNGEEYLIVDGREIRHVWCKMNDHPFEDVDFESEAIDIETMTLKKTGVRLALTGLTLKNYRSYDEFYICSSCGKVYWQGSHWKRQVTQNYGGRIAKDVSDDDSDDSDVVVFYDAEETL